MLHAPASLGYRWHYLFCNLFGAGGASVKPFTAVSMYSKTYCQPIDSSKFFPAFVTPKSYMIKSQEA